MKQLLQTQWTFTKWQNINMAVTPWVARGTLSTTLTTTLYTVTDPADVIVTNVILTNKTSAATTVTLDLDAVYILSGVTIDAYSVVTLDIKQPVITSGSNKLIRGGAAAGSTIDYHISGVTY